MFVLESLGTGSRHWDVFKNPWIWIPVNLSHLSIRGAAPSRDLGCGRCFLGRFSSQPSAPRAQVLLWWVINQPSQKSLLQRTCHKNSLGWSNHQPGLHWPLATWTFVLAAPRGPNLQWLLWEQGCDPEPGHPSNSILTPSFCSTQSKYPDLRVSHRLVGVYPALYTAAWRLRLSQPKLGFPVPGCSWSEGITHVLYYTWWRENIRDNKVFAVLKLRGLLSCSKRNLESFSPFWKWICTWKMVAFISYWRGP